MMSYIDTPLPFWFVAAPEMVLLTLICVILVADLFLEKEQRIWTFWMSIATLAITMWTVLITGPYQQIDVMDGAYVSDSLSYVLKIAAIGFVGLAFFYARDYLRANDLHKGEYYILGLFGLLAVNGIYLASITAVEWATGETYQDYFYQVMFLVHLVLGLLIILPVVIFGFTHMRLAHDRPNRRAVKVGYGLFTTALLLLGSGIVLTRLEGVIVVKDPVIRNAAYWAHVLCPLIAAWLFVLHRLAGRRINEYDYSHTRKEIAKGEEMGRFNMGSTVILLTAANVEWLPHITPGHEVKVGQLIGHFPK